MDEVRIDDRNSSFDPCRHATEALHNWHKVPNPTRALPVDLFEKLLGLRMIRMLFQQIEVATLGPQVEDA